MQQDVIQRRRLIAAGITALIAIALLVGFVKACGGGNTAPASGAARLVPADALVYVHVSTDENRNAVKQAFKLLDRFPSLPPLRDELFQRLAGQSAQGISYTRDVKPWLGREAALALLNTNGQTAGSLIIAGVSDRSKAEAFLRRVSGPSSTGAYHGVSIERFGPISTAFIGRYLAIGQEQTVRGAIDRDQGRAPSLERAPAYAATNPKLPSNRFADAFVSSEGVRRLLAPQGGVLGAAGVLLDQPALMGTSIALSADGANARVTVRSELDPAVVKRQGRTPLFSPELTADVPKGAMAYLGVSRLDRSAKRLLAAGAAGATAGQRLTQLLGRAQTDLSKRTGVNIQRDVLPLFKGETALWLSQAVPAPVLTLIARTKDEAATRLAFSKLQVPLAKLFTPPSTAAGLAPTFSEKDIGGGDSAFSLKLGPGVELDYAIFGGKLVISTSLDGITAVKNAKGSVASAPSYQAVLGSRPKRVSSLVFLDFSQLLRLGEQTGLTDSQAYLAVREDLSHIKAIGSAASSQGNESTVELLFQIS
jgi:hypothetical protein